MRLLSVVADSVGILVGLVVASPTEIHLGIAINEMLAREGVRDPHLFVFLYSSASSIKTSILLSGILQTPLVFR